MLLIHGDYRVLNTIFVHNYPTRCLSYQRNLFFFYLSLTIFPEIWKIWLWLSKLFRSHTISLYLLSFAKDSFFTCCLLSLLPARFRSPSSYMVSVEPFPDGSRSMSCKFAQMGPRPITFLRLWPAAGRGPHCRRVPTGRVWRRTGSAPRGGWWRGRMAGSHSDCSTREMYENTIHQRYAGCLSFLENGILATVS